MMAIGNEITAGMTPSILGTHGQIGLTDLAERFGNIPAQRIRMNPLPGTATKADVIRVNENENVLCELIDGTLVEKAVGAFQALLAAELIYLFNYFLRGKHLGFVLTPDAMIEFDAGKIRQPDVSYFRWDQFPDRKAPRQSVWTVFPLIACEIYSPANTYDEMQRKLKDYLAAKIPLIWYFDPELKTVEVYAGSASPTILHESDVLDGGAILTGLTINLKEFFAAAQDTGN
jgi:Uma2 family endonuclease